MSKTKTFATQLVYEITPEIHLPLIFCLFIELLSNLQILSLSLLPLLESVPTTQNKLSYTVNYVLHYLEPFKIFDPFESESDVIVALVLFSFYFLAYFLMIGYIAFQIGEKSKVKDGVCQILSFITFIHGKIVFYLIHCFTVKALSNKKEFCSNIVSFACTMETIAIPSILLIFNVTLAILQELYCYQIHQNKSPSGIKNNLHSIMKLFHKLIVIILLFAFEEPAKILILFSVLFTLFDFFILHSRLPFYNKKMLKLSVSCSTISTVCALMTIGRFFVNGENICLIILPVMPSIVKISLRKLNQTLWNIFSLKFCNPFHVVHLPVLIEDYLKKNAIFPLPDIASKSTLYSMGFIASDVERIIVLMREKDLKVGTIETQKAAYSKIIEELYKMLQKYPQNELLLFTMAQIYSQVFEDNFRAYDLVNRLSEKNQSFIGKVCLKNISHSLEATSHQDTIINGEKQEKRKSSHLNYFAYRAKIDQLKKRIKLEIQDHLKLWKNFSSSEIDILSAATQASLISAHTHHITNNWNKHFEGHELLYVNATLMYGLYLEIVQGIPDGGASFIKKAYSAVNNKWHLYREVIDVTIGNSAVVVVSIESDKIGRIIDSSSSVRELFKVDDRKGLIGSNIAIILPNVIAVKHNDLIKEYQKHATGNIDHHISSYAKTLKDEYFRAEVTLHVSPLTHKGLNLVGYIRKLSDYQSMMIVDPRGNIIEYSKDLTVPLNLYMKKSYIKADVLCPHFRKLNQAFAVLYGSDGSDGDAATTTNKRYDAASMTPKGVTNFDSMMIPLASPTTQKLLLSSSGDNIETLYKSGGNDRILSSNEDEPVLITHKSTTNNETTGVTPYGNMSVEEAQEIWEAFKNTQELKFYPLNKKGSQRSQEVKYKTEIEPFFFDQKWYRIVKMKPIVSEPEFAKPHHEEIEKEPVKYVQQEEPTLADKFADMFPTEAERTQIGFPDLYSIDEQQDTPDTPVEGDATPSKKRFQKAGLTLKTIKFMRNQTISMEKISNSGTFVENKEGAKIDMKKLSYKAQSVASSQANERMTGKRLKESLNMEKPSASSKLVIKMVFLTVIAIIISVVIHLLYTTSSLTQMQASIEINRLINDRLAGTILNWQAMMILYSRATKLRPIDYKVPMYQAMSIASSMTVLENAKSLAEELDAFQNAELIKTLYEKNIKFYEPLDQSLFDNGPIDQFSGNQILLSYYFSIARYNQSYLNLKNSREFLFSINNTANDYLLTLGRSVDDLAVFFEDTKRQNIHLVTAITTIEILFVLSPLVLILVILVIITRTYSKLFKAIGKINENSLAKRVKQLEDLSLLFEEHLEDDVPAFQKFKSQGLTIKALGKKTAPQTYSRKSRIQPLIMHLLKYLLIATLLISVMIALVAISLEKSVQGFNKLETLTQKAFSVYDIGSQVRMVAPSFYVEIIFHNNTNYKIKNQSPAVVLTEVLRALTDAGQILISTLSNEDGEIFDPVVHDILSGDVCKYVTAANLQYCITDTKGRSFGLIGLHTVYSIACDTARIWLNTPNPTFALGTQLSGQYATLHNNAHLVMFDAYDYLTNYLIGLCLETADQNKNEIRVMFYGNLAAVLVSMFLIRMIVLTRLQGFDLGIRRILRIIPYKIIEENKIMSCYMNKMFKNELKILKQMS